MNLTLSAGYSIEADKNQCNYLLNVMRLEAGDIVRVFDGKTGEWIARLAKPSSRKAVLEVVSRIKEFAPEPDLWLLFAPVKSHALDNIVSKATELGVSLLQPVITKHTVVARINSERMYANAVEASEQCERITVPEVREAMEFKKILNTMQDRKIIYCDETGSSEDARMVISKLPQGKYAILTGPEGGFANDELEILKSNPNCIGITLGPRILKADTAVVTALSVFMSCLGDWDKKPSFRG